jgi:hypothetical protein
LNYTFLLLNIPQDTLWNPPLTVVMASYLQTMFWSVFCLKEWTYVYVIWKWIDWYRKYQPDEPEYEVCCQVSEANQSQTSYSVEQANISGNQNNCYWPLHRESIARCKHHMQEKLVYCCTCLENLWFGKNNMIQNIQQYAHLEFDDSGQLSTKIYDKRNDFNFKIINFPNMCSNIPASLIIISAETESISTRFWYRNINFLRDRIRRIFF